MNKSLRILFFVACLIVLLFGLAVGKKTVGTDEFSSPKYVNTVSVAPNAVTKEILRLRKRYPKEAVLRRTVILKDSFLQSEKCTHVLISESFQAARSGKGLYTPVPEGNGHKYIPFMAIMYSFGKHEDLTISVVQSAGGPKGPRYYECLKSSWHTQLASKNLRLGVAKDANGSDVPFATYDETGGGQAATASVWRGQILVGIGVSNWNHGDDRSQIEAMIGKALLSLDQVK